LDGLMIVHTIFTKCMQIISKLGKHLRVQLRLSWRTRDVNDRCRWIGFLLLFGIPACFLFFGIVFHTFRHLQFFGYNVVIS
jgi:hypothetical protein